MSRRSLVTVLVVQLAALVTVCLLIGDNGWDDGAITLAFARTLARHGRIALTAHSETVEGFSSLSWLLLNALPALARPSYRAAILVSQILSASCIVATTALLGRACGLLRLDKISTTLCVITFSAWGCSFFEASNGMEMGLLASAILVVVNELLSARPRMLPLATGVALAVTTRFEAAFYVALLAVSVATVPGRRAFWGIVLTCGAAVSLLSIWRLAVFSDVLPNTFWAKRWAPYATFGLRDRLASALELPGFFLVPSLVLACLFLPLLPRVLASPARGLDGGGQLRPGRRALAIVAFPALGAVLMGGLVGKPWGYGGRMAYFAFPLGLLLFSMAFSSWVRVTTSRFRLAVAVGLGLVSIGLSMKGFPSTELSAALHGGAFGVSPHTYAESGRVFRRFAAAAELSHPIILTPDVGGLALCCDEFRIVDLGLLSNRTLAHRGHVALADVLETESPDLVQAHWAWASSGRLYDLATFRARYWPAFADRTKLWIRRDVADLIERRRRGCWLAGDRPDLREPLRTHRYAAHEAPEDRSAFDRPGRVFVLAEADHEDPCQ